jgi:hypothetical protein
MADRYDTIPDDVKRKAAEEAPKPGNAAKKPPAPDAGTAAAAAASTSTKSQRRLIKLKRAGVVLTQDEVKAIKLGRKKLRKELRARGIKSKHDFDVTASSLGLYFDRGKSGFLFWLGYHWLGALLGLLTMLLLVMFLFAMVQQLRGHFTVNLSSGMFRQGFTLSETAGFENTTTQLFANPAEDVPCISINQIPNDIDEIDGSHNDTYFAYTFYIRNEGEETADYTWSLDLNSETQSVSDAVWVMLFQDGEMRFYARPNRETGKAEALPGYGDNGRGYLNLPVMALAPDSDQFEIVSTKNTLTYYRVVPDTFTDDTVIASDKVTNMAPQEIHKYTVVLWLEGDDPDCNDDAIGGHLGVEINFRLSDKETDDETDDKSNGNEGTFGTRWRKFWDSILGGLLY